MKKFTTVIMSAVIALALTTSAFAGDCCQKDKSCCKGETSCCRK